MTVLIVGPAEIALLLELKAKAAADPIDAPSLHRELKYVAGRKRHMERMAALTVALSTGFTVTFSIETGHEPGGVSLRHMSMASPREDKVPVPAAVWMVAEHLGFQGSLDECQFWLEHMEHGQRAVNIVQPMAH